MFGISVGTVCFASPCFDQPSLNATLIIPTQTGKHLSIFFTIITTIKQEYSIYCLIQFFPSDSTSTRHITENRFIDAFQTTPIM